MDKILSARIDEAAYERISGLARLLKTSKKRVIEQAVESFAAKVEADRRTDVFEQTSGAWKRDEPPAETVHRSRGAFHDSMTRRRT